MDKYKRHLFLFLLLTASLSIANATSIYDFTLLDIDGREVSLDNYSGKVVLIVNVASKCGYTYQYEGLEAIYSEYRDRDFVILGFPSNDFLGQESGTDAQIKEFCTLTYGVSFPMFSKIKVAGRNKNPLYAYLTDRETNPDFGGRITWNFNKFLIDKAGNIVNRFSSKTEPDSEEVLSALEKYLR